MDRSVKELLAGNLFFVGCSIFYLIWWCVAFKPDVPAPKVKSVILFIFTAACGLGGLVLIVNGIRQVPFNRELFSVAWVAVAGVALYLILLVLTSHFLHRQLTTELLLIIGWGVLCFCEINALYGSGAYEITASVIACAIVVAAMLASLACYLAYYQLEPSKAYIDGMLPLILIGAVMAGLTVKIVV